MYTAVLAAHSWIRWIVVILGLVVLVRSVIGLSAKRPWEAADARMGRLFVASLDVQFLLGLVLYFFLSPITTAALGDLGGAMRNSGLRFWAIEHAFGMIVGLSLAHVGVARVRKAADPVRKHRMAAVFFAIALVAILASVPWPGTPNGRPMWRPITF